jgi:sec-independent protein translocase protein TatB
MVTPPTIQLASLGMADSLILMVLALVVFGPRKLPQIGKQIGKLMYEFRKASNDFKFQMEEELRNAEEADRRKKEEERVAAQALAASAQPADADVASQVSDARPGTPTPIETPVEETTPRILPPSTGEPVAAARPTSHATPLHTADNDSVEKSVDINPGATVEANAEAEHEEGPIPPLAPAPEQAAHHG